MARTPRADRRGYGPSAVPGVACQSAQVADARSLVGVGNTASGQRVGWMPYGGDRNGAGLAGWTGEEAGSSDTLEGGSVGRVLFGGGWAWACSELTGQPPPQLGAPRV